MTVLHYPPSIDWELTTACNHNCIHCYNYWRKTDQAPVTADADRFLQIARRIINAKPVSLQITGGEPLLVWRQARRAIEKLLQAGICVSINTNATLVDTEISTFLANNQIDTFVSFPCFNPAIFNKIVNQEGAFEKACNGIHLLIDAGVRVSLNMVVTKKNLPFVYDTAKFAKEEFCADYFSATKASFPQNAEADFGNQILTHDEFNDMLHMLLRVKSELSMRVDSAWVYSLCGLEDVQVRRQFGFNRKCTCGKYSFVIDAVGNIKACGCDSQSFGNIMNIDFADAIMSMKSWRDGSLLPEVCKVCRWLPYCGGGCRSDAFSIHGKRCLLDSTADISNCNAFLAESPAENNVGDENIGFTLNPACRFTKDGLITRVSYKTNYDYLSWQFAEFLQSNSGFSVEDLASASGRDKDVTAFCLKRLRSKKILLATERKNHKIAADCFALLISPYVCGNAPVWVNDYAGMSFSNTRHT